MIRGQRPPAGYPAARGGAGGGDVGVVRQLPRPAELLWCSDCSAAHQIDVPCKREDA
jgi:hypothetical protein